METSSFLVLSAMPFTPEVKEVQEGLSYGAHQMRDGVSLSKHERMRLTVSPTKILSLDNLEAYIKLPGSIPVTKTKFKYEEIIPVTKGFVNYSKRKVKHGFSTK